METFLNLSLKVLVFIFKLIRFFLFTCLVFFRPVISFVLSIVSVACLFGFLAWSVFWRQHPEPMIGCLVTGIVSTIIFFTYDFILSLCAPDNTTMIAER